MSERFAVIDGHLQPRLRYLDQRIAPVSTERREELRAIAILANDRVRMREQDQAPPATLAYWNAGQVPLVVQEVRAFHEFSREVLVNSASVSEWVTRLQVSVLRRG